MTEVNENLPPVGATPDTVQDVENFLSDAPAEPDAPPSPEESGASPESAAPASSEDPPVPPTPPTPTDGAPPAPPAPPTPPEPSVGDPPVKTREQEDAETIETLRKQVVEMSAKISMQPAAPPVPEPVKDAQGNVIPPTPTPPPVFQFVKDEAEFDGILKSAEEYNKHMTGVMYKTIETVFRTVPKMMSQLADQHVTARLTVKEFYDNNKDLLPNKAFVGMVANEISAKNPDWNLEKVMGELGKEVRTRLRMGTGVIPQAPPPGGRPPAAPPAGNPPAFAGGGGGGRRGSGSGESPLQKEINELIED